ncbi:putative damage-inducible protein DinB [Nocardioides marinisabuli]|uniref:Putative damage-inducible protein DinB n=1 Tax=Nocardioides marinisabuli TaxID=419476 RepID=A0A7Y9F3B1_9ACTN|nr:DinB family protein [Nocardioides marinisabuli]NYD57965.1 putative damage-inducible protein DinB [Nocardioides marinisabuli]
MTSHHGMFVPADEDPRGDTGSSRGERGCVTGYLEAYRHTIAMKCQGLSPTQLATASVPPSAISLLGLVRHLARVEHHWARRVLEGRGDLPRLFDEPGDDAGFTLPGATEETDETTVHEAFELWRGECAYADGVVATASLDDLVSVGDERIEVRDVLVHLVEEYARHAGHADLVRECLDGRTGQ